MNEPIEPAVGESLGILPHMVAVLLLIYGIWGFEWKWDLYDLAIVGSITAIVAPFVIKGLRALYCYSTTYRIRRRLEKARTLRRASWQATISDGEKGQE